MAQKLSTALMARVLDISPRRLQQLVTDGIIEKAERGKFDLIGTVHGYIRFLRDRLKAQDGGSEDLMRSRASIASTKATLAEINLKQVRGELVPADEVLNAFVAQILSAKARLLAIPAKLAHRIVNVKNVAEAETLIREAIHEALADIADADATRIPVSSE